MGETGIKGEGTISLALMKGVSASCVKNALKNYFTSMCVVTKSLRKREDAPTVYLAVAWMQLSVAMYR